MAKVHNYSENLLSLEKKVMIYGYLRVSSDKQTVENQRFEINNFCKMEKFVINDRIEETIRNHSDRFTGPKESTMSLCPFAVLSLTAGGDLFTVGKLMGYTDIKSTQVYADVVMDTKIDAIDNMSSFFSQG